MSYVSYEYLKAIHAERLAEAERYRTAPQLRGKQVIRRPLHAALRWLRGQRAPTPTDPAEQPPTEPPQVEGPRVTDVGAPAAT